MSMTHIYEYFTKEDLQELLKGKFGQNVRVINFTSRPATVAGDNYGSSLLSLNVNILNNNSFQALHIVAKLEPPTEFLREVFDVEVTFRKEINLYKLVIPALLEIQYECGLQNLEILNFVPTFYGSHARNESVKSEAVLLLENLKVIGYDVANRLMGLDLEHCKLVMRNLASFHALCIALRIKKPDTFKKTVEEATMTFRIGEKDEDEVQLRKNFIVSLRKNVPESQQYLYKMENCFLSYINFENASQAKEPFATLVHNDLWTNNMLFKYAEQSQNRQPYDLKLIDFQLTLYCSPARDIIFFLYSSAQRQVLEKHFDHLIDIYYDNFVSILKKFNIDVKNFSKPAFMKEINSFAPTQLYHILFMLSMIYADQQNTQELHEFTSKEHIIEVGSTELCRKKVIDVITDFDKRGWIKETCDL